MLVLEMNGGSREHAAHNLRDALLTPERLDAGALGAAPERALLAPGYGGAPDRNIVARFRGAVSLESPDQVPSCYLSNDLSEDVDDLHARGWDERGPRDKRGSWRGSVSLRTGSVPPCRCSALDRLHRQGAEWVRRHRCSRELGVTHVNCLKFFREL